MMLPAPSSLSERSLVSGLSLLCLALATVAAMVGSLLIYPSLGGEQARGSAVSVFSDAAVPAADRAVLATSEPVSMSAGVAAGSSAGVAAVGDAEAVFGDEVAPQTPVDPDERSVELGMRFSPKVDGTVSALRFYRSSAVGGARVGTLWGPSGEVMARVEFPALGTSGWQSAAVSPAVAVSAGDTYVVSYLAPAGRYPADEEFFAEGLDTETLAIPAGAGVYAYGAGIYPTENYRNSNYYVDVAFEPALAPEPSASPEPTPPAEATPTPTPTVQPTVEPTVEPTVQPQPTASAGGVFDADIEPDEAVDPDRASVELGMRFSPKVDGEITALRFYRNAANTGALRGTLWDADGGVLAGADFPSAGEGWQTATLAAPVPVKAGEEYVVSYLARLGQYAADEHFFDVGIENEYLSVPAGAGVYAYGAGSYPAENYRNSNYYVDVRFVPEEAPTPTPIPTPPTPEPTASVDPSPEPTIEPVPGDPAVLDLPTEAWWGGSAYYAQWDKAAAAGWDEPSFFPISVFFGKPSHADELAAIGVNTYMGAEHDGSPMSMITDQGISVLAQGEWTPAEVGDDPRVVGWHVSDECDMGYSGCTPDWSNDNGEQGRLAIHQRYVADTRALDDGRFVQANFGNGVLGTWWAPETMDDHLALVDVSSVDKYAYTSPGVNGLFRESGYWPESKDPASAGAYGWQQDRMESFMAPVASKPNWVFVETSRPFLEEPGARTITGDQIEGAVWNALIHGAAGISYFQHNNSGCGTYSLVECSADLREKVGDINASVTSMAPVLNSPSYAWNFGAGLETTLKAVDGYAYVIGMTDGGSGSRSFTLPDGLSTTVEVVGEGRTLSVTGGTFTDSFSSENDHHIYRIALD
ncbi:DUF4082 domain-containing protein [Microbacterium sp. P05]|uniref:DUF4082 domain-containing protein n=1 Tax=Microbacterium sp. P05 TaxID=3366948 RepID=UPI003746C2D6